MDQPYKYAEDITGQNPDNLVSGEEIALSQKAVRVAKFRYGPVFVDSIRLFDKATMQPLTKDEHYRIPWISHELSLKCAQEIAHSVLITDPSVSGELIASYQAFGGSSMPLSQEIMDAYEILLNDNRSVDWTTGVFGKPNAYPPSAHPTFFGDIFGWNALAFQFERLSQAITLGNTPAFEQILKAYISHAASIEQMETGEDLDKLVSLRGLLHIKDKYHFNTMKIAADTYRLRDGGSLWVDIEANFAKHGQIYYWRVEPITASLNDFVTRHGMVRLNHGKARFFVQLARNEEAEENETFEVSVRLGSPDGVEVIRTDTITIRRHGLRSEVTILDAMQSPCLLRPPLANHVIAHAITPRVRAAMMAGSQ